MKLKTMTPATKFTKSKISAKISEKHLGFINLEEVVDKKYAEIMVLVDRFKDQIHLSRKEK